MVVVVVRMIISYDGSVGSLRFKGLKLSFFFCNYDVVFNLLRFLLFLLLLFIDCLTKVVVIIWFLQTFSILYLYWVSWNSKNL